MEEKKQSYQRYEVIEDYVQYLAKQSQITYRSSLNNFFKFLGVDPQLYLHSGRDFNRDIMDFALSIKTSPPMSQRTWLSAIKGFFQHNDVVLKPSLWDTIRKRNHITNRSLTKDFVPTNEDLRKLLVHTSWTVRAGLDFIKVNVKTCRITWELWLLSTYPSEVLKITLSQGHTSTTSFEHYMGIRFNDQDKVEMLEYIEGWK